ncbi:hypothetical protein BDP81DRAFT_397583 [Colletotrichum phormii]|uniref:Uncharacterized protein n=1 Tax=Colletotrichum phormii TaxID=359342 RepID=A0AAI9ZJM0_9PEZI|nr:uncharacterized protein BDP81DRAFT_397583 [Colletotrichum phormii]KAK1625812.1 hypothetical protein BDP81DRAFT_397583 [Colletotrichum phormii]
MPIVQLNGPVLRVDHFVIRNKGLSFAFALERVINPSTGAEKTLTEYDGPSYFGYVVLYCGVQDVDDDELDGMDD